MVWLADQSDRLTGAEVPSFALFRVVALPSQVGDVDAGARQAPIRRADQQAGAVLAEP